MKFLKTRFSEMLKIIKSNGAGTCRRGFSKRDQLNAAKYSKTSTSARTFIDYEAFDSNSYGILKRQGVHENAITHKIN